MTADSAETEHLTDIGFRVVVVLGRRPAADDVPHRKRLALHAEALVVGLKHLPGGTIAVGHTLELYKFFIFLLVRSTLPAVGRVSDIERVVVSDTSWFHVHFILN